jgi:putative endonuclease
VGDTKVWQVYMLRCADGTLYTGISTDVGRRLRTHNAGRGARYTRARLPVRLVWLGPQVIGTSQALREERKIKRLPKRSKEEMVRVYEEAG